MDAVQIPEADATTQIDHAYPYDLNPHAYIYASCLRNKHATGFYASIVISPEYESFKLSGADSVTPLLAAAVGPSIECRARVSGKPLINVRLEPTHELFRAFRTMPWPGFLPLDRSSFATWDDELRAAVRGDLPLELVASLTEGILAVVAPQLSKVEPQDARVTRMFELLRQQPSISLEEIATELELSYYHASHLFTHATGLSFRTYRLWHKVKFFSGLLYSGETFVAAAHGAGFSDSAHVSRVFKKLYGAPPTYFFDKRLLKIHVPTPPRAIANSRLRRGLKRDNNRRFSDSLFPI